MHFEYSLYTYINEGYKNECKLVYDLEVYTYPENMACACDMRS